MIIRYDPVGAVHSAPIAMKAAFAGIARDCEPHLGAVLSNIDRLSSIFTESAYVVVENDSSDDTKGVLARWGESKRNFTLFSLDGLGRLPVRTLRTEAARNTFLEFIKSEPRFGDFDLLCVMDMDDANAEPIDIAAFRASLDFLQRTDHCAGVFANQIGTYYDLWTLRHAEYCPGDVWYDVLEYAHVHKVSDQEAFDRTFRKRIRSFDPSCAPIEVDSAFGGLGIYRLDYVRRNSNPYLGSRVRILRGGDGTPTVFRMQVCEHVHFNIGLRLLGGRLFIMPSLINGRTADAVFPCSAFRHMCF